DAEGERALAALLDQAAVAIERAQLMEEQALGAARAETEALRTALLTSLGHDLRTPLTAIRGAIGTLRANGDALSPATRADLLEAAEEETQRLTRYLSNILGMVRIESGQITPRREVVDLAEAIEVAVRRAGGGAGRIAVAAAPGLLAPRLDPVLLDQVLGNLLDNALKFSGSSGAVRVRAVREGPEYRVAIEDDGPGIPPEDLPRVFDPFHRALRTDRIAAGTGLGLSICRGLVQAMGGRILAESPVPPDASSPDASPGGRGTRITLRFPV
ncbi:sensor histidine kinase, partial [Teichococcus cervicalis]